MTNLKNISTLRPGLLVNLKTSISGNVSYVTRDLESDHRTKDGARQARWETERTISDPEEHERAVTARGKIRSTIRSVCAVSAFGLLCPESDGERLDAAIKAAHAIADEFNASANLTRLRVYVLAGRIAPDDVEAVKAINSEVRDLLQAMEEGVANLEPTAIREAAAKAKSLGNMLTPDAAGRIQVAIEVARKAASQIKRAGEQAAQEVDRATVRRLAEMRTSFLDLDEAKEVAKPKAQGRMIDLDDQPLSKAVAAVERKERKRAARELDL